jgi:hypothetical protein
MSAFVTKADIALMIGPIGFGTKADFAVAVGSKAVMV